MDLISENPQELFDTAIRRLAEQGCRSVAELPSNTCLYESEYGRCAIGWLLTPKALSRFGPMRASVTLLVDQWRLDRGPVSKEFLVSLQAAHDHSESRWNFRFLACSVAAAFSLKIDVIQEVLTPEWCATPQWKYRPAH